MNIKEQLKNIVISLYQIVEGQNGLYVKKYSLLKSEFGVQIELHIFKNCSGNSIGNIYRLAKQVTSQFQKDLIKNKYVDFERTKTPQINDIMIYGGKNQAYIGFTGIIYCQNIEQSIKIFEKIGYQSFLKEENNVTRNRFI